VLRAIVDVLLRRPYLALAGAIALHAFIFVTGQHDLAAADPLWYASVAHRIADDPATVFASGDTHPFIMRVGLTMPVALLYRLFGVSTLVTNLYMLVCAVGILAIVYIAANAPRAKLVGMLLGAFCLPLVRSMMLNVDVPAATLMALSVLCLARRDRGAGWVVGAAVALVAAFLVKESALWCGFVWLYAIASDLRTDDPRTVARRFGPGIAVGLVLAAAYFAICARVWGSPFARFWGIQDLTFEHAWTLHGKPAIDWVHRLTWQPPLLLVTMFQALLVPALASPWLVRGRDRIWPVATLVFVLLYWFGSSSLSAYSPLPISTRMILPVLPVLLVTATLAADAAIERASGTRWLVPLAVVVALAIVLPASRAMFGLATRPTPETDAFALVRAEAREGRPLTIVCGEPRCVAIGNFHFGFRVPPHVRLLSAEQFAEAPLAEDVRVRALVHLARARGVRRTTPELDRTETIEALKLRAMYALRAVRLYDAGDGRALWRALQR
jgi:hypothetical protein